MADWVVVNLVFDQVVVKMETQVVNLVVVKVQDQVDLGQAALTESSRMNEVE